MGKNLKSRLDVIISSTIILIASMIGITFAWFPTILEIARPEVNPGALDSEFSSYYWDTSSANPDKWTVFDGENPINVYLGEMNNLDFMPDEAFLYFRFSMTDTDQASYKFEITLSDLEIIVISDGDVIDLEEVSYYDASPSQKLFQYYYVTDASSSLDPTAVFLNHQSMTAHQVTHTDQSLSGSYFVEGQWLYLMFTPRLEELQNIIRRIPFDYSPYALTFAFSFSGETRTEDE